MYGIIVYKEKKAKSIDKKMDNVRQGKFFESEETPQQVIDEELLKLEIDDKNMDEYIFFNGKMVKKSVLLKLKQEAQEREKK